MPLAGAEGALDAGLLVGVGELAGDEHLLLGDDLEGLGDEVGEGAVHDGLEVVVVLLLEDVLLEVDGHLGLLLVGLEDEVLVPLLTLPDGLVQGNDERHVNIVGLGEEEEAGYVIVLDPVVVLGATHAQVAAVQLDGVTTTGSEEGALGLVELNDDISGGLLDVGILHDALLEQLGGRGRVAVGGVGVGIGGDVKADGHELVGASLDGVGFVELQLDLVAVVAGQDALADLGEVDAHHLLAVAGLELLPFLVGILQHALFVDEASGFDIDVAKGISGGGHGVLGDVQIVQLLEDLPDLVVVGGGEPVEAELGVVHVGVGLEADVTGPAEDGPLGTLERFGRELPGRGNVIVLTSADCRAPLDPTGLGGEGPHRMAVKTNVLPLGHCCNYVAPIQQNMPRSFNAAASTLCSALV
mmetsp:Transcript_16669/g.47847  ORF Transcript_16669/g.47847 Transcript_16669/m.47847 type:complete len:413 (-) Transcript_16669:6-1244(-)